MSVIGGVPPQQHIFEGRAVDSLHYSQWFHCEFKGGVAHPVGNLSSSESFLDSFVTPLKAALANVQRHPLVVLHDVDSAANGWEIGTGYWVGVFNQPLFGINPTGRSGYLRYTEMVEYRNGAIAQWYLIPDFIDLMDQAGVNPLRASLGAGGRVLPPKTMDGLYPSGCGEESIARVMAMLEELGRYDGIHLDSMNLAAHWHPDFLWYGPGGIGTTRGIDGFRCHHQGPFLEAFPDRVVDHHTATVGAGNYAATGGWPHMHATHKGSGWLGLPATGSSLELRVIDIWRRDGQLLVENWVAIDIPHMLQQMGLDPFQQMVTLSHRTCTTHLPRQ